MKCYSYSVTRTEIMRIISVVMPQHNRLLKSVTNPFESSFNQQRGVGMIEVLVTLVILSVGLLGVASLQFVGSFSNKEALARTQAVMVTEQLTERLRASMQTSAVTDGFVVDNQYFDNDIYNFANLSCSSGATDYECYCNAIPAAVPNCQTGQCNSAQLATFDAYQMSCALSKENPQATIQLSCDDLDNIDADDCTAGSIHKIIIKWPVQNWRNSVKKGNTNCNSASGDSYDCVVKEVTL